MPVEREIRVIPIMMLGDVKPGDVLSNLILQSLLSHEMMLEDGDIIVIAQKIVSKAEGQIVSLNSVTPSPVAIRLAKSCNKDPRLTELILRQSKSIVKISNGIIISETKHGFICANAGVDQSNLRNNRETALLLPNDPDSSAKQILFMLKEKTNRDIAVVITDSFGRPFRKGQINVAIGVAGMIPIKSYIGEDDMYGKKLRVTEIAIADELASAAELAMGKSRGVPVVLVRGFDFTKSDNASINEVIRERDKDLFR